MNSTIMADNILNRMDKSEKMAIEIFEEMLENKEAINLNTTSISAEFILRINHLEKITSKYLDNAKKSIENKEAMIPFGEDLENALSEINITCNSLANDTPVLSLKDGEVLINKALIFTERVKMFNKSLYEENQNISSFDIVNEMRIQRIDSISSTLSTFDEWKTKVKENCSNIWNSPKTISLAPEAKIKGMLFSNQFVEFNFQVKSEMKKINNDESIYFSKDLLDKIVNVQKTFDKMVNGNHNLQILYQPLKKSIISMKEAVHSSYSAPGEIALFTESLHLDDDPDFSDDTVPSLSQTIENIKSNCKKIHETMDDRIKEFNTTSILSLMMISKIEKYQEKDQENANETESNSDMSL